MRKWHERIARKYPDLTFFEGLLNAFILVIPFWVVVIGLVVWLH